MGGFAFWLSSGVDAHTRDKGAASARTAMVIHIQVIHEVHDRSSREAQKQLAAPPPSSIIAEVIQHRAERESDRAAAALQQTDGQSD